MEKEYAEKILLVDDEEHLLVALRDFLTFEGYTVNWAKSGEEALSRLQQFSPDLIILDISMPGIGGLGFLRRATATEHGLNCPVLVLTARSNMSGFFEGMDIAGFLAKPCSKSELLDKIREMLAQHVTRHAPPRRQANLSILLGEDDHHVSAEMSRHLEEEGHKVTVMTTGPEILEVAPKLKPDVIVMKWVLSRMNGDAVASLLAAMPSTHSIPVILYRVDRSGRMKERLPVGVTKLVRTNHVFDVLVAIKAVTKDSVS